MAVSRGTTQAVQFVLVANTGLLLSSSQTSKLQQAITGATASFTTLLGRSDRTAVFRGVFGRAGQAKTTFDANLGNLLKLLGGSGLGLQVQLRSAAEMNGATVAYAPRSPSGGPRLYLSAAVLESGISSEQIAWLLLKGAGHNIDNRLNGDLDSPGDEGKAFAAALSGRDLTTAEQAQLGREASGGVVNISGTAVAVETQPNLAPTLTATASNSSFSEAQGLGSQAAAVALFSNTTISTGPAHEASQTITQLNLSVAGLRDGSQEVLWVDGTAIQLGASGSGSTAGTLVSGGLAYSLTITTTTDGSSSATLSLSKAGGFSGAVAAGLVNGITYQNTNTDNPTAGNRTITITGISDSGGAVVGGTDTSTPNITSIITVIAVNDAPQLGSLAAISLTDTAASDSFTASNGSLTASDPEAGTLSYGLDGAITSSSSFDGISYNLSKAGSYGTLYLNSSTGQYRFQPKSDWSLNALSTSGSDSFSLSVSDGTLSTSTSLLVNFNGSSEAPEQYVLVDDGSPVLNTDAQALWEQALTNASRYLSELLTRNDRDAILQDAFGRAGTDPSTFQANLQSLLNSIGGTGLRIDVDLRTDAELNGAAAAYAAVGHTGAERIYVNGDLINSGQLDLTVLTSALLEEYGHALDRRLNGSVDSPGDEGQLFASEVTGVVLTAEQRAVIDAENDTATLTIEGVQVAVEEAFTNLTTSYTEGGASVQLFSGANGDFITNNGNTQAAIRFNFNNVAAGDRLVIYDYTTTNIWQTISIDANNSTATSNYLYANGATLSLTYTVTYNAANGTSTVTVSGFNNSGTNSTGRNAKATLVKNSDYSSISDNPSVNATRTITLEDFNTANTWVTPAGSGTRTVNIIGVNDAPLFTSGTAASFGENATGTVYAAAAADPEGSSVTYSISGTDSALFNIDSSGSVTFKSAPNFESPTDSGADNVYDITVTASDGSLSTNRAVAITVTNVNEAPTLTGTAATLAYTENGSAATIDGNISVADPDSPSSFNGGFVQAAFTANGTSSDQLSVLNIGTGTGQISVSGTAVSYQGTQIGTIDSVANGVNGADLKISLNSSASTAATQALARAIAFRNSSENPSTAARTVTFTLNDGGNSGSGTALTATRTATVNITAVNDAPVGVNDSGSATEAGGTSNATAGSNASGNVLTNDTDGDNTTAQLSVSAVRTGSTEGSGTAGTLGTALTGQFGTFTLNSNGSYSYVINESNATVQALNTSGTLTDSFNYTVSDGSLTDTAVLNVTINGANDAPTLTSTPSSFTVTEDVAGNLQFSGAPFADVDSSSLTVTLSIADGTITGNAGTGITLGGTATARTFQGSAAALNTYFTTAGNITYTTASNNNAARTLTVAVSDGSLSSSSTATVNITAVNDAPVGVNDSGSATEAGGISNATAGSNASGNVLTNDTDSDNTTAQLSVTAVRTGSTEGSGTAGTVGTALTGQFGTFTLNSNGSYSYVINESNATVQALNSGGTLTDSFNYTLSDGSLTDTAVLNVTINGANDAPTLTSTPSSFTVTEDVAGNLQFSGAPFADVDSSSLTVTLSIADGTITGNAGTGITLGGTATARTFQGTATALNTYFTTAGNITYTTASNNNAARTLTVAVSDGSLSSSSTATVNITAVNDAPVGVNDSGSATEAGGISNATAGSNASGNVLTNDTDSDNTTAQLSVTAVRTGSTEGSGTAGTVGTALTGQFGTFTLNSNGSYSYVINESNATVQALNSGGTLTDSFNYTLSDGSLTDTAVLNVTINGANDAPVGVNDSGSATEAGGTNNATAGTSASGNVLTNDTDVDTAAGSRTVTSVRLGNTEGSGTAGTVGTALTGIYGTLTLNSSGSYTYVVSQSNATVQALNAGGTLTDSFNYTLSDGSLTDTAVLNVTINGTNDAPIGVNDSGSATEDGGIINAAAGFDATGNVLTNDTDVDNTTIQLSVTAVRTGSTEGSGAAGTLGTALTGQFGTLTLNSDGSYSYVINESNATVQALNSGGTLTDSFNYTVSDGSLTDTAVLNVTINGANDAPTLTSTPSSFTVTEDVAGNLQFSGAPFADVDSSSLTVTLSIADGTITGNAGTGITLGGTATARTFQGSAAALNTYFTTAGNITYTTASNNNAARTLTVAVSDGSLSSSSTATVNITAVNDAPTANGTASLAAVDEDTVAPAGATISSLFSSNFTDPDSTFLGVVFTANNATAAQGTWQWLNGSTWTNIGTGLSGTAGLYLTAATSVRFLPAANFNGTPGALTARLVDSSSTGLTNGSSTVNTSSNGGSTAYSSVTVSLGTSINAVNDAPVFTGTAGATYSEQAASSVALIASAAVSDVDATNFNGGSVTVSLATYQTGDVLSINNQGTGAGQIGISGSNVTLAGTTIGTFSGGSAANLVITLNSSASAAAVQALMGQLRFSSTSDDPTVNGTATTRALTVTLSDGGNSGSGGAQTASRSGTITLTSVNDAPVIGSVGNTVAYTENAAALTLASTLTVSDVDDTNIASGSVSISSGFTAGDTLTWTDQSGITASYSSGTGVLTLTGSASLATYQALLSSVAYSSSSDDPTVTSASRTVTWSLTDANSDGAGAATRTGTTTINLTTVNDAPVNTVPAAQTTNEDSALVFSSANGNLISISDPDARSASVQVQLTVTNGTLALSGTSGLTLTAGANNSSTMTYQGTVANINTALAGLTYSPTANYNGSATLTLLTSDLGNTGGAALTDTDTVAITVSAVNDAPVFTGTAGATYSEQAASSVALIASAAVSDVDATNFNGGSVTVSLATYQTGDVLSINNQGTGAGQIGISGSNVTLAGTTIGTFSGGSAANLVITLNSSASAAAVQALMGQLRFSSTSDDPTVNGTATTRALTVTLSDGGNSGSGGAQTASRSGTITLTSVNDAPVIGSVGNTVAYTENAAALTLASTLTVSDVDDTNIASGSVSISSGFTAGDTLTWTDQSGITASYSSGTGVLTLTGSASLATYQALLSSVAYSSSSDDPTVTSASRTVTWSLTDANSDGAGAATRTGTTTINLTTVNDAPVNTVPAAQTTNEDSALVFSSANGNLISISDPDARSASVQVQLTVTNGTLALSGTSGLTLTAGANNSSTMTYQGTVANINTALAGLTYSPTANYNGSATLTLLTSDLGNTGGAALTDTDTVAITVSAVNDAPTLTSFAGAVVSTNSNTETLISFASLAAQGDEADIDGTVTAFVVQTVSSGTLRIGSSAATATAWVAGSNDVIDATRNAYWTAGVDAAGTINAFTVRALDEGGLPSATSINVPVVVSDVTPPSIASIAITSASGAQNNSLNAGDSLTAVVTFSEAVTVITSGGTPTLQLTIGGSTVNATYAGGSGTSQLSFTYTIQNGQNDTDGIGLAANSLSLNGGSIRDSAGNNAALSHGEVADNGSYLVDTSAPAAPSIAVIDNVGIVQGMLTSGSSTDETNLTVRVSLSEAGAASGDSIQLYNASTALGTAVTLTSANISAGFVDIQTGVLAAASYSINARLIDKAGNIGTASETFSVSIITPATGFNATGSTDAATGGQGDDILTISATAQINLGDRFDGSGGIDVIKISTASATPVTISTTAIGASTTAPQSGFFNFEAISLESASSDITAQFNAEQFSSSRINLQYLTGTVGTKQTLDIINTTTLNLSSLQTFTNWTAGTDTIEIYGPANTNTSNVSIIGSGTSDVIIPNITAGSVASASKSYSLTGGGGTDSFYFPTKSAITTISGSGKNGVYSGMYVINDFTIGSQAASGESIRVFTSSTTAGTLPTTAAIQFAANNVGWTSSGVTASTLTLNDGSTLKSFRYTSGLIEFSTTASAQSVATFSTTGDVAAAIDFINRNAGAIDGAVSGIAGNAYYFRANLSDGVHTYALIQGSGGTNGLVSTNDAVWIDLVDVAGSANVSNGVLYFQDGTEPTITAVSNPATAQWVLVDGTLSLTLSFSEEIRFSNGGTATILVTVGSTDVTLTATGNTTTAAGVASLTFSAALADGLTDSDGVTVKANSLSITAGTLTDSAGNTASSIFSALTVSNQLVDTDAPTLSITSNVSTLKAGETSTLSFSFSEAPTDFTAGDISTTGGSLSDFTVTADPKVYTATFTPTGGSNEGSASITVASGSYSDAAGNTGGAGTTPSLTFDTLAPTLAITSNVSTLKAGETATISFSFSEAPTDFTAGDISTTGGSLSSFSVTADPKVYTATFTPTGSSNGGSASITVASGSYFDAAGNTGGAGTTPSLTFDTLPPDAPSFVLASDTGIEATDGITKVGTVNVSGVEANATWQYSTDAGVQWSAAQSASTTSFTLAEGTYASGAIRVRQSDLAGNVTTTPSQNAVAITVDASISAAGSLTPSLVPGQDTGTSGIDNLINITKPTLRVSFDASRSKAGDVIEITRPMGFGPEVIGTATLSSGDLGNGYVLLTLDSALEAGSNPSGTATTLTAHQRDSAGNSVTGSSTLTLTVDQMISTASKISLDLDRASDSGVDTDHITNDTTPTINVSFDKQEAAAGDTITVFSGSTELGSITLTQAHVTAGLVSITVSSLSDSSYSLSASHSDAAGNSRTSASALSIQIDTNAPVEGNLSLHLLGDSGTNTTDNITNVALSSFRVNFGANTGLVGETVSVVRDGTVLGFTTLQQADITAGHATVNLTTALNQGLNNLTAVYTDIANNSVSSAVVVVSLDTMVSTASSLTLDLIAADDLGSFNSDNLTNKLRPTLEVSFEAGKAQVGDIIAITRYVEINGEWVNETIGSAQLSAADISAAKVQVSLSDDLDEGTTALSAVHSDVAGNTVTSNATLAITLDTMISAPAAISLDLVPSSDSGSSSLDHVTSVTTPEIQVWFDRQEAAEGDLIQVKSGNTVVGSSQLSGTDLINGYVFLTLSSLSQGSHTLSAVHSDAAGNSNTSSTTLYPTLVIDTTAPTAGTLSFSGLSDSGSSESPAVTTDTGFDLSLSGTTDTISLYTTVYEVSTDGGTHWSTTSSSQSGLADGSYQFRAVVTDKAGNSSTSNILSVVVDNTAPTAGTLSFSGLLDSGSADSTAITTDGSFDLSLSGATDSNGLATTVYEVSSDGGTSWNSTTANQSGLADGSYQFRSVVTDKAGNFNNTNTLSVMVDNTAPTAGSLSFSGLTDSGSADSTAITTDGTFNLSLADSADANGIATTVYQQQIGSGAWTDLSGASLTGLADGSYQFRAVVTDKAGNFNNTNTLSVVVDNTAPTAGSLSFSGLTDSGSADSTAITTDGSFDLSLADSADANGIATTVYQRQIGSGAWTDLSGASLTGLADGSYQFRAVVTDKAGNVTNSNAISVVVDNTAPTAGTLSLTGFVDSGVSTSDGRSNDNSFDLSLDGASDTNGLDTTIYQVSTNGGTSWSTTSTSQSGLLDGSYQFRAVVTDKAGNTKTSNTLSVVVDASAPNAPSLALGSGVSNGATALEATQGSGVVTVSAASGSSLLVSFNRGDNTVTKTLTATGASQAVVLSSADLTTLGNGSISVTAIATDAAGNSSNAATTSFSLDTGGPTLTSLSFGSNDGNLSIGESLTLVATLSETVYVTGTPTLVLNNGGSATYSSGSGTNQLTFTYAPLTAQSTNALTTAASTALRGTITDQAGNSVIANSFNNITATNGPVAVDSIAPTLTTISYGSNDGALASGEAITLVITGSEALKVTGSPTLALNNGGTANYVTGSGTNQLLFSYTPATGQSTADLATAASNALGGSGTITDLAGNSITAVGFNNINPTGTVLVDTSAPTVSSIAINSATGAQNGQLNTGDTVAVTVTMSEAVIVNTAGGSPQLRLNVGGTNRTANYASGSGTTSLSFTYIIAGDDSDANGISIDADSFILNGASIRDLAGNSAASLNHNPVSDNGGFVVNNTLPQVTAISFGSNDGNLAAGEAITLLVDFDETVLVSGTPSLLLNTGGTATYSSGSNSSRLSFNYTPSAGQSTAGLAPALSNAFSGTITDLAGNAVVASSFTIDPSGTVAVDAIAPLVSSLAVSSDSSGNTLLENNIVSVTVTMTETVTVTGTPTLTLNAGDGGARLASFSTGSGSNQLVFTYTIQSGDTGITIDAGTIALNGGSIKDAAGNNALLSHQAFSGGNYNVDTLPPTISALAITSANGAENSTLNAGDIVFITATMSETVNVTGSPLLALNIGGNSRSATYVSGSGSSSLVFRYTIQSGDNDADGISISADALSLNTGDLIEDAAGVDATTLSHDAVTDQAAYKVDTTAPVVNVVAISAADGALNNRLNAGDVVRISVSLSEVVNVSGSPQLILDIGGTQRSASYVSGSDSSTLLFSYTLQPGESDSNGISIVGNGLLLNGGSLRDAAGNAATLSFSPVEDNNAYLVDTTPPEASFSTTISTNGGLTATINSGGATRDNTLGLSGTASDAGVLSKVEIFDGSTYLGDATLDSNAGTWTYNTPSNPALTDGNHSFTARVTDLAGNVFITSAVNARIDTTAPGRPSISFAIDDVVPGTANVANGGTTNDNTPTLRVSLQGSGAVAGDTAQLLDGETVVASATLTSINITDSFVQLTPTLINDGAYTFTTRLIDAVGNVSQRSTEFSLIIDREAPTAPSFVLVSDTGISTADGITQNGTINISGLETASTSWQYSLNGGVTWLRGSGSSFTLPNGAYVAGVVQVRQADLAGNRSPVISNSSAITVDNTAPTIAISANKPSLGLVAGSPDSATITFVLSEAVSFSLSAVSINGSQGTSIEGGLSFADGTLTNLQGSGNIYTASFTPSAAISKQITLSIANNTISDLAGNNNSDGADANNTVSISVNTLPPQSSNLPTLSAVTLSSGDSGAQGDWITNSASQTISGTLSRPLDPETDERLKFSLDNGASWFEVTPTTVNGVTTFTVNTTLSSSARLIGRVEATVVGSAPVIGTEWSRFLTIDTSTYTGSLTLLNYSGNLNNGSAAGNDNSFELSLPNAEPGATISYQSWNGAGWDTLTSVSQSSLADGSYRYRAIATDAAANTATSAELSLVIDRTAPTMPTLALNNGVSDPLSRAQLTASNGAILVTSYESGATVTLTLSSDALGSSPVVKTLTSSGGTQSVTFTSLDVSVLGDGTLTANATITDAAGNSSSAAPLTFSYVAQPLTILGDLSISRTQDGSETGPRDSIFTFSRTGDLSQAKTITYKVSGTARPGIDFQHVDPSYATQGYGSITFAAGSATATLSLPTIDNTTFDSQARTITVGIIKPDDYNLTSGAAGATATLIDNDVDTSLPVVTFSEVSITEGSGTNPTGTVIVTLNKPATSTVTMNYVFRSDTATGGGVDFTGSTGTATITAGNSRQSISFTVTADTLQELDEVFYVDFSGLSSNARFAGDASTSSSKVTIVNDDNLSADPTLGPTQTLSSPGQLFGGTLRDSLTGSNGADTINAGAGNDTIRGQGGADSITGSTGTDLFVYSSYADSKLSGFDIISDFLAASQGDRIGLLHAPSKAWFAGTISTAPSLTDAVNELYADANRISNTDALEPLGQGDAVVFRHNDGTALRTYILIDNPNTTNDLESNLLIRVGGLSYSSLGQIDPTSLFAAI